MNNTKPTNGSRPPEISGLRTWIEIDKKALASNYEVFRKRIGKKTKLMAVVKSNAYGHGLVDFSKEICKLGADRLAVDSVVEAVTLRKQGIDTPILVLGYTLPERLDDVLNHDVSISVSSLDQLSALSGNSGGQEISVHVKVDTGMHRQGFLPNELDKVISFFKTHGKIKPEGLFTHFSSAKNPSFPDYTKSQIREFERWREAFKKAGFTFISHASATAGSLLFPGANYDMVRIGIGLYGLWPSKETKHFLGDKMELLPILSWLTVISETKKLPKGSKIGYDCTETLERDSLVGVCPIGYWHGYPRTLSSIGHVIVKGKKARILGRVSMDMISVDLTDISDAVAGDHVTLIGNDGKENVTANEIADLSDTSYYEIVTRLNPLIKRIYN